jgi:hypothetical protein
MSTGEAWVEFDRRLGPEWKDLATALDVPAHVRDRFERGHEAAGIRAWLERTGNLTALVDAVGTIGRTELVPLVRDAVRARVDPTTELFLDLSGEKPPPSPSRRRTLIAVAAVCLLLASAVTVAVTWRGDPPSGDSPTARASSEAAASAAASATSDPSGVTGANEPIGAPATGGTTRGGSASLTASRSAYLGTCPPPNDAIRFTAKLDLGGATGLVQYRWIRSDGLTSDSTVQVDSPTARPEVSTTWLPMKTFSGSLRLEILAPVVARSNEVAFSVTCQIAISANISITPSSSTDCAAIFTVNGVIEVSDGPIDISYGYAQNSNPQGGPENIQFLARGRQTQTISTVIQPLKNGTFTMAVEVESPRHVRSNQVTYSVTGCPG